MLSKSRLKYIQSLHHKKFRDEEGCFIAEGPKISKELLQEASGEITAIYALDEWINENQTLLKDVKPSVVFPIDPATLEKISALSTPNQVVVVAQKKKSQPDFNYSTELFLMLDSIQDPGNFGTIVRIADWFGISTILCSYECADLYNPKVVQSTMGSIFRLNIVYVQLTDWCKAHPQIPVYAATLHGKSIHQIEPIKKGAVLMGNESKGVNATILGLCREQITIPRKGKAESLNAAIATGIILSHIITT